MKENTKQTTEETKKMAKTISGFLSRTAILFLGGLGVKVIWNTGIISFVPSLPYMKYINAISIISLAYFASKIVAIALSEEILYLLENILDEVASKFNVNYTHEVVDPEKKEEETKI